MARLHPIVLGLSLALSTSAVTACVRQAPAAETKPKALDMKIESPAFTDGERIPTQYTCEGEDISPPLSWSNLPARTKSLALIVDDPDAPDPKAPQRTWVHWVVYDIPPDAGGVPEAVTELPHGAHQGRNDWGRIGYGGPCPPIGEHRYFHKLYALDAVLGELAEPTKAELERAMTGHILAEAQLIGTYQKHQ
jgi:Raf kinase inhibitor-like YbhB/YbcL family protein